MNNTTTWIKTVTLSPPSLDNNIADSERLSNNLKTILKTNFIEISINILRKISKSLRKWNYCAKCVLFKDNERWMLLEILPPDKTANTFGVAIDLGTTKIELRLSNLETGEDLHQFSFNNPQLKIGPDVLTRIHYAESEERLSELNKLLIDTLNNSIEHTCKSAGIKTENIYLVSIAGNTVMTHFLLNLNPQWIIMEPYIPTTNNPGFFRTTDLGIKANINAGIYIFPNIGSYFGGDLIAGILYSGIYNNENISMFIDVGTNAEVVLGNKDWLIGCAGAAGPALESGATKMGMNAGPGVIDKVKINPQTGKINYTTIETKKPSGICGSGLIDLVAHLFLANMVNISGKFIKEKCKSHLIEIDNIPHFILIPASESATGKKLTLSQTDLDSLIRSKAAMYAILETITKTVDLSPNDINTFYVGGTFGSFINPKSAISIGMLPDLPLESYKTIGNCSLGGASMFLKSDSIINDVNKIKDSITYLELNVNQDFMNNFSGAKFLPHTNKDLFPSVIF